MCTCTFTECSEKFIHDVSICAFKMQIILDNLKCQSLLFQKKLIVQLPVNYAHVGHCLHWIYLYFNC